MALKAQYTAFLAAPTADALAEAASLHYVPSLTTVRTAPHIVSQLTATTQLKRVTEKAVAGGAIESGDALMLDVETTIEFVSDGGGYLPGLDDNFLADRVVTFLVVCSKFFSHSLPPFLAPWSSSFVPLTFPTPQRYHFTFDVAFGLPKKLGQEVLKKNNSV